VDAADVGVIQRGERLRFPLKAGEAIWIRGEGVGQQLQRDVATQLDVPGAVHLAHAAAPEQRLDLVRTEASARLKGQARIITSG
jgi:hypothetical protein